MPISAIIFGGRRSNTVPLVFQAFNWTHGVFVGATMGSETTAAATGKVGVVRRDPMAMLPFCGYHMGDYFQHWLDMQKSHHPPAEDLPRQLVPQDKNGKFLWPGFGENMRVLEWIVDRVHGRVPTQETLLGWVPRQGTSTPRAWTSPQDAMAESTSIKADEWKAELKSQEVFFEQLGTKAPEALMLQRKLLISRLGS